MQPVERFPSQNDFLRAKRAIMQKVESGDMVAQGLDNRFQQFFVEKYLSSDGDLWLLAAPDQAFRGFLRKEAKTP